MKKIWKRIIIGFRSEEVAKRKIKRIIKSKISVNKGNTEREEARKRGGEREN